MLTLGYFALVVAVTAVVAGLAPTELFFGEVERRRVVIVGLAATVAAHVAVHLGVPYIFAVTVDDVTVFPVWAVILGFPVAGIWRWIAGVAPRRETEAERIAEIQAKARDRARKHAGEGRE